MKILNALVTFIIAWIVLFYVGDWFILPILSRLNYPPSQTFTVELNTYLVMISLLVSIILTFAIMYSWYRADKDIIENPETKIKKKDLYGLLTQYVQKYDYDRAVRDVNQNISGLATQLRKEMHESTELLHDRIGNLSAFMALNNRHTAKDKPLHYKLMYQLEAIPLDEAEFLLNKYSKFSLTKNYPHNTGMLLIVDSSIETPGVPSGCRIIIYGRYDLADLHTKHRISVSNTGELRDFLVHYCDIHRTDSDIFIDITKVLGRKDFQVLILDHSKEVVEVTINSEEELPATQDHPNAYTLAGKSLLTLEVWNNIKSIKDNAEVVFVNEDDTAVIRKTKTDISGESFLFAPTDSNIVPDGILDKSLIESCILKNRKIYVETSHIVWKDDDRPETDLERKKRLHKEKRLLRNSNK